MPSEGKQHPPEKHQDDAPRYGTKAAPVGKRRRRSKSDFFQFFLGPFSTRMGLRRALDYRCCHPRCPNEFWENNFRPLRSVDIFWSIILHVWKNHNFLQANCPNEKSHQLLCLLFHRVGLLVDMATSMCRCKMFGFDNQRVLCKRPLGLLEPYDSES